MLILPIKKKWYDMILSGEKKEEYREVKPYYTHRLRKTGMLGLDGFPTGECGYVILRNGYSSKSPSFAAKVKLKITEGYPKWGATPGVVYYTFEIKEVIEDYEIWNGMNGEIAVRSGLFGKIYDDVIIDEFNI